MVPVDTDDPSIAFLLTERDPLEPARNIVVAETWASMIAGVSKGVARLIEPAWPSFDMAANARSAIAENLSALVLPRTEPPWITALVDPLPAEKIVSAMDEQKRCCEVLSDAGWLPHELLPLKAAVEAFDGGGIQAVSALVERHISESWEGIEASLAERAGKCLAGDGEALSAYREALHAHRVGLYRASCRTVFPEIERVVREGLRVHGPSTSIKELRERIWGLPCTTFGRYGLIGLWVAEYLDNHCYMNFKTEEDLAKLSSLPNRHAIIHGKSAHSTVRDSINALFVADFVFHAVAAVKEADCRE